MQKDNSARNEQLKNSDNQEKIFDKNPPKNRDELIERLKELKDIGWISTRKQINDGLVGNTLEDFLGIEENNLPLPDMGDYEIKAQRIETSSLTTLFHYDPYPRRPKSVVVHTLGPKYGWAHKEIDGEWSFRITMYGHSYTNRGFKITLDENSDKLLVEFNPEKVDPSLEDWLDTVLKKGGPKIDPQPYWKLSEIRNKVYQKIPNIIYAHAECRNKFEFSYDRVVLYEGIDWDRFKEGLYNGEVFVDFDARKGHNHGTKFRIKQGTLFNFYRHKEVIF